MTKAETVEPIKLEGAVQFRTVEEHWERVQKRMKSDRADCTIDFAGVDRVDSSALSLCLCAWRLAREMSVGLHVINVPEELRSIANLVGLDEALLEARH